MDLDRGALLHGGTPLKLRPKSFAVLCFLVERHGRLVSRREVLDAVWGHNYVSDAVLSQCLIEIRRALGDEEHQVVKTVPRRGYVFEPAVEVIAPPESPTHAATSAEDAQRGTRRHTGRPSFLLLAVVVLVLAGGAMLGLGIPPGPWSASSPPSNSIAVLPFSDMSPGRDQAYLAEGMAEEILNMLAGIPELHVTARTSSFVFRDEAVDIPTVARQLNVGHVLEGSVRRSEDDVRITAQLVDAARNAHVWSMTYDRKLGNVLEVQEEIASRVAESLRLTLVTDAFAGRSTPPDPRAYEEYLRGQFFWNRRAPGDTERAQQAFKRAISIDPDLASAWTGLAGSYNAMLWRGTMAPATGIPLYKDAIDRALELAPNSAEAHARASRYFILVDDRVQAQHHWERANALNPNSTLILGMRSGVELAKGRYREAIDLAQRVVKLDPLNAVAYGNLSGTLLAGGRFAKAETAYRRGIELNAGFESPSAGPVDDMNEILVSIYILTGRYTEALALVDQLPDAPMKYQFLAMLLPHLDREAEADAAYDALAAITDLSGLLLRANIHAHRGDSDGAFRLLKTISERTDPNPLSPDNQVILDVQKSPFLIPLRSDPRWAELRLPTQEPSAG